MKKAPIFIIIVCSISTLVSAQLPLNETIEFNHQNIIKWEGEEYFHDNYDYNGFEINSEKVLHFFYSQGSKRVDWGFITKIEQSEKDEIIIYTYHIKSASDKYIMYVFSQHKRTKEVLVLLVCRHKDINDEYQSIVQYTNE